MKSGFTPVYVADIHLGHGRALHDITDLSGFRSLLGIVRLHGTPIAFVEVPIEGGACCARPLAQAVIEQAGNAILFHLLTDALATGRFADGPLATILLSTEHLIYSGPTPLVTIAVPTRSRTGDLRRCLDALARVDYPSLEVLIIDNAPCDDAVKEIARTAHPTFRYIQEPRPGLNWARNRAITEARGEILAFTDDDAVVDAGWIKAISTVMSENPDVMAVTGLVVPEKLDVESQLLFERHGGFGRGFTRRWVRVGRDRRAGEHANTGTLGTGANMAFRRSVFDEIGSFDPALDAGTPAAGGGDLDLFFRVLKAGHTLVYEPAALVRHRHRHTYAELRSQLSSWGVGMHSYLARSMRAYPDERVALVGLAARLLLLYFPRRLLQSIGGTLRSQLIFDELRGSVVGLRRYGVSQRHAAEIAARFGSPFPVAGPQPSPNVPRAPLLKPTRTATVDIDRPLPSALPGPDDSDRVRLSVMQAGRQVAVVEIVCGGAPVSRARLSDALAVALSPRLHDGSDGLKAALREWLGQ